MTQAGTQDSLTIRPAWPLEAERLTALALCSKAYWGYDQAFLERCRDALAVTPAMIEAHVIRVAERGGAIQGFYILAHDAGTVWDVEQFFVEPGLVRQGVGRALMDHLKTKAAALGATGLRVESDPHAEPFYRLMGFEPVGQVASDALPGRTLPLLTLTLERPRAVAL